MEAVWLDSGSIVGCRRVLGEIRILRYLQRTIKDQFKAITSNKYLQTLAVSEEVV
jgi:hypothetical protein